MRVPRSPQRTLALQLQEPTYLALRPGHPKNDPKPPAQKPPNHPPTQKKNDVHHPATTAPAAPPTTKLSTALSLGQARFTGLIPNYPVKWTPMGIPNREALERDCNGNPETCLGHRGLRWEPQEYIQNIVRISYYILGVLCLRVLSSSLLILRAEASLLITSSLGICRDA